MRVYGRVSVKAKVLVVFHFFKIGVKDFSCNIYHLVFNVTVLEFWGFSLGFRN